MAFFDRVLAPFARAPRALAPVLEETPAQLASPSAKAEPILEGIATRPYDAWDVDPRWMGQIALNPDKVLRAEGGLGDMTVFQGLLDDTTAFSAFEQRRLAVVSRPWEVEPADDSAKAQEIADKLREEIDALGWDRVCDMMLYGRWYGYAVAEIMWTRRPDGLVGFDEILVPDRDWFRFTNAGELRLRSPRDQDGVVVPPNKFWSFRAGGSHDYALYGVGLAHHCYWPVYFKRNVVRFWSLYLEKYGKPTAVAKHAAGATAKERADLLDIAKAVGRDSAVTMPDTMEVEFVEAMRASGGASSYDQFVERCDQWLTRLILGQTMTSKAEAAGLGSNQADVQEGVRNEWVRSDSDLLHESFNRGPVRWWTTWNYGENVKAPRVYRKLDDDESLDTLAERDAKLKGLGWNRTEDSFREVYGEGYEKAEPLDLGQALGPDGKPLPGQPGQPKPPVAANDQEAQDKRQAANEFAAAQVHALLEGTPRERAAAAMLAYAVNDPRPLYVRRDLVNVAEFHAWAKEAGFPEVVEDAHVTVAYSRQPVDWFAMGTDWHDRRGDGSGEFVVPSGGPRKVDRLGDQGAVVLHFDSDEIRWRHESMRERGASWDYEGFHPHVTITYRAPEGLDLETVVPYAGKLVFGPEIFEPIQEDWSGQAAHVEFTAQDQEAIDRLALALSDHAEPMFRALGQELQGKLEGVHSIEQVRIALLDSLERFPADRLAELTALPLTAMRAAAEAGVEESLRAS